MKRRPLLAHSAFDSLGLRLTLIPAAMLALGLVLTILVTLQDARPRIRGETSSGLRLGEILARAALRNVAQSPDAPTAIRTLQDELPRVRHIGLVVIPAPDLIPLGLLPSAEEDRSEVPLWFARPFLPKPHAVALPIVVRGETVGTLLLLANPLDEIGEIWEELRFLTLLLVSLSVVIVGLIVWTVRRSLRPLRALADGFDRLEQGDFSVRLGRMPIAELRRVGAQFDHLARSLAEVTQDNRRLIDRLMSLQEAERMELAHELHDEFGPSLFGVRAELAALRRALRAVPPLTRDALGHGEAIGALADGIQASHARMLDRLRPLVLDQLGLADALRHLIAGWEPRAASIRFSLTLSGTQSAVDDAASLALYRTAQEALTNAVRHSRARTISITLAWEAETLAMCVRDDGIGIAAGTRRGYGLLGMTERVRGAGGALRIEAAAGGGTLVSAALPARGGPAP